MDLLAYPDDAVVREHYMDALLSRRGPTATAELRRYRLRPGDSAIYEKLMDEPLELPRLNYEANNGRAYSYIYSVSQGGVR